MKINLCKSIQNRSIEVQKILLKAEKESEKTNPSNYKFVNEYIEALFEYYNMVFEVLIDSIALSSGVDPNKIQKSFDIPVMNLIRCEKWNTDERFFYKSLFSRLKKKFIQFKNWFKKFNINKGKPIEPVSFQGKFKYNPDTRSLLTNEEWDNISDGVVNFLSNYIQKPKDEMIVRASLFGKLIEKMKKEGLTQTEIENKSYEELEKKYGKISTTKTEAVNNFNLTEQEIKAIDFAQQNAGKYISVKDSDLKNKIVNTTRDIITEGMREGKTASKMVSDFYQIAKKEKDRGIKEWNRDIQRIIQNEMKNAQAAGFMIAAKQSNLKEGKKKTYMVFSGAINPDEKLNEPCNVYIGQIVLMVDEPLADDKIKDPYAKYAVWPGKTNAGRNKKDWWICINVHPYCKHWWEKINPEIEEYDKESKMIVFKED